MGRRRVVLILGLQAVGLAVGIVLAVAGLPYGRVKSSAFAELYHGSTDTAGYVHIAIDCDPGTAGTQDFCSFLSAPAAIDVDVTVANSTSANVDISTFNFVVRTVEEVLDPLPGANGDLNGNPDAVDGLLPGMQCQPPPPNPDRNADPLIAESFIACFNTTTGTFPVLPPDSSHTTLATVHYAAFNGYATLELMEVGVYDSTFTEIASCDPINSTAGLCFDAVIALDGGQCNPNGQNTTDHDFISNAPVYSVNDFTRARSDTISDSCDTDLDNDGLTNHQEDEAWLYCSISVGFSTVATQADSDGDRYLDGAECFGSGGDPRDPAVFPSSTACGGSVDADGDGVSARVERCFYNTSDTNIDTDGDGVKDGCEMASINADTIVSSGDQGLLAAEMTRAVPPSQKLVNFDINKDGVLSSGDQGLMASFFGKCP